jgi:Tfp pilus assembly protein PilV
MQLIAFRDEMFNPPTPPFTKGGLGEITDKTGLTLVEVLIALVIVLGVSLALMQTALISIDSNTRNILRDEAVRIAETRMNEARNIPFTSLISDASSPQTDFDGSCESGCNDCPTGFSTGKCRCRDLKNISGFKFCSNLTCTELGGDGDCATSDTDNKMVNFTIGWKWKGEGYTHSITTIRKR